MDDEYVGGVRDKNTYVIFYDECTDENKCNRTQKYKCGNNTDGLEHLGCKN